MLTLILNVLLCLISCHTEEKNSESQAEVEVMSLRMIDISSDSILSAIINDATDKVKNGERCFFYSVCIERYKEGDLVRIIQSRKNIFNSRPHMLGYTIVNDCPVVIYKGGSNYRVSYSEDPKPLSFTLGTLNYKDDVDQIRYYYILGDIYARFSPEVGWIWSDGKPDE